MAKRILRYLRGSLDHSLVYDGNAPDAGTLAGWSDADWANDVSDRKSVGAFIFYLAGAPILWRAKKQRSVAKSSTAAEYMAASEATSEAEWMRRFLTELGLPQPKPTIISVDNKSAIFIAHDPILHGRTRHVAIHFHYIKDLVEEGEVTLAFVPSYQQRADGLTKSLRQTQHAQHLAWYLRGPSTLPLLA